MGAKFGRQLLACAQKSAVDRAVINGGWRAAGSRFEQRTVNINRDVITANSRGSSKRVGRGVRMLD